MGVDVRPAAFGDRPALERMLVDCQAFSAEETGVALDMIDNGLAAGPDVGYPLFVAESEGVVRGYTCIGPTPFTQSTWHLYWICVHPEAQGRGVGCALQ